MTKFGNILKLRYIDTWFMHGFKSMPMYFIWMIRNLANVIQMFTFDEKTMIKIFVVHLSGFTLTNNRHAYVQR